MSFSVALCTYNGERHLSRQLESIARQQRPPAELIVCDDRSTDKSLAIAEDFAGKVSFHVRIHRNKRNLGYAENFRQAVRLCKQELIAFCDQDDVWHEHKLARLSEEFERGGEQTGGVFSNGDLMDSESRLLTGDLWGSFRFTVADQQRVARDEALPVLLQRNVVTGMAFAVRRRWACLLDDLPMSWPHDAWLAIRLADQRLLRPCPEHLVSYRVHGTQQIGVPINREQKIAFFRQHGIAAYLELARQRNLREYRADAAMFDDLLSTLQPTQASADLIRGSQDKSAFSHGGITSLEMSRWRRWPHVLSRLPLYRRYTKKGLGAAVRDLVL